MMYLLFYIELIKFIGMNIGLDLMLFIRIGFFKLYDYKNFLVFSCFGM